jgi:hypothetical protein
VRRQSRHDALASLTDTDRRLLTLLSEQRVLTQTQLERLLADIPARTLRYRTERLTRLGLVGRSRPYREKGSAPFHFWPSRASDAFVRGEPAPRGGERAEPNPQFLHHAERLSELYVLLCVEAPTVGLRLHSFQREGDAREVFRAEGRERALAPDALIHLHDERDRGLLAFVELDMGTMSHPRLKTKAAGYAAYAAEAAWTESHPFCPCLLFLTTTEARALAFLRLLHGLVEKQRRYSYRREGWLDWFSAAACPHAREPERALAEACWDDLALAGGGLSLADSLARARAPYDATRAKKEATERALEQQRSRLYADANAWRWYLQEKRLYLRDEQLTEFGEQGTTALQLLLHFTEPMDAVEQRAFAVLARQLADDPLDAELADDPPLPTPRELDTVNALADRYRAMQQHRLEQLARRYGEGPSLRRYQRELAAGRLLNQFSWDGLADQAKRDHERRSELEQLRIAYLDRREREARRRKHDAGIAARLAHGRTVVYALVDRDRLHICPSCDEIVYPPKPQRATSGYAARHYEEPPRCHFCDDTYHLAAWDPARAFEVEHGPAGADLTSGEIAGSMDGSPSRGGDL